MNDAAQRAVSSQAMVLGPFSPSPALSLYVLGDGQPVEARLQVSRGPKAQGERVLLRVFDSEEKPAYWQYVELGPLPDSRWPSRDRSFSVPAISIPASTTETLFEHTVSLDGRGIHQIRMIGGNSNSRLTVTLSRPLRYGVSFQNGEFKPWGGQGVRLFAYVPQNAEELEVSGGPIRLNDSTGLERASVNSSAQSTAIKLNSSDKDSIWSVDFPTPLNWSLRAAGFPLILCPDAETARTLRASLEELPDGTVVTHKFQKRIAELLPELLSSQSVGRAEDLISSLKDRRTDWLRDPVRNLWLLNSYAFMTSVGPTLQSQNVDPQGHWGGTFFGWQNRISQPRPENRWDRLKSIPGLWAGTSSFDWAAAENLAQAALLDAPFNPYFGKRELLNRAAVAALRDLMTLGEDEVWRGTGSDMTSYPGFMAFPLAQKNLPVYRLVAPHMSEEVRKVWTEGLQHIIDRTFADGLVTSRNQSAHYLLAFDDFAQGSGNPRYQNLALAYAQRFANGIHPAGFHLESTGPDASYIGMTHWHEAVYYRQTQNPVILDSLKKSYTFFNHTVAPEPTGKVIGASNFSHRTADGFHREQYDGARGILDGILPEVGLWAQSLSPTEATHRIEAILNNPSSPLTKHSNIQSARYLYFSTPNRTGVWPAYETSDFIRNFGGELIAVKRPAYYAAIYVGKPAWSSYYIAGRETFRDPLPANSENGGGLITNQSRVTPFLGGGLSLFWTPQYGNALLGTNWSPLTRHGLVALVGNPGGQTQRFWEDYFATQFSLNEAQSTLTVNGRLEQQPLTYSRRYTFLPGEIRVSLTIRATADYQNLGLFENFPLVFGPIKGNGVRLIVPQENNGAARVRLFRLRNQAQAGVEVALDRISNLRIQRNGLKNSEFQIGRIEVELPARFRKDQSFTLNYTIRPIQ